MPSFLTQAALYFTYSAFIVPTFLVSTAFSSLSKAGKSFVLKAFFSASISRGFCSFSKASKAVDSSLSCSSLISFDFKVCLTFFPASESEFFVISNSVLNSSINFLAFSCSLFFIAVFASVIFIKRLLYDSFATIVFKNGELKLKSKIKAKIILVKKFLANIFTLLNSSKTCE